MMRARSGQSSFETIILFSLATIMLSLVMTLYATQFAQDVEERNFQMLLEITAAIENEFTLAEQAIPGYQRNFTIPPRIGPYEVVADLLVPNASGNDTELIVTLDAPIGDQDYETARPLGPNIHGSLNGGNNTLIVTEYGIMATPEILPAGAEEQIAYAAIPQESPSRADPATCIYGVANAERFGSSDRLVVYWISNESGGIGCEDYEVFDETQLGNVSVMPNHPNLIKGVNVSCAVEIVPEFPTPGCSGWNGDEAQSENRMIADSLPEANWSVAPWSPGKTTDYEDGGTFEIHTWSDIGIVLDGFDDADPEDLIGQDQFSLWVIKDGTNARYLECDESCIGNASYGGTYTFNFTYSIKVHQELGCEEADRLSFKIKIGSGPAPEDSYTLIPVELGDDYLECTGGAPE